MTIDEVIIAAGGVVQLARTLGVSHSTVVSWRRRNRVPVAAAMEISEKTGIPQSEIRPDIWPAVA